MSDDIELYKKAYQREKLAREQAELILESKVRDIYLVNKELEAANEQLKEQQEQMVKTEKMASLGVLSAGVAHEINNPLAFIKSNIGTLKRYFGVYQQHFSDVATNTGKTDFEFIQEDAESIFEEVSDGMERVQTIVQELKSFARSKSSELEHDDPNGAMQSAIKITHNQLKYKCEVDVDLQELDAIPCNINELSQVFINLLMNAADAVEESGNVTVRSWMDDKNIHFTVKDDGCGIPEEHLDQIFTPFFTAKPVGKGTGLGLSVSFGIIEDLGGTIEVETEVGEGTCFHIRLPRAAQ